MRNKLLLEQPFADTHGEQVTHRQSSSRHLEQPPSATPSQIDSHRLRGLPASVRKAALASTHARKAVSRTPASTTHIPVCFHHEILSHDRIRTLVSEYRSHPKVCGGASRPVGVSSVTSPLSRAPHGLPPNATPDRAPSVSLPISPVSIPIETPTRLTSVKSSCLPSKKGKRRVPQPLMVHPDDVGNRTTADASVPSDSLSDKRMPSLNRPPPHTASRQQMPTKTSSLPPFLVRGSDGLVDVALHVWKTLGFFSLQPHERAGVSSRGKGSSDGVPADESCHADRFIELLKTMYSSKHLRCGDDGSAQKTMVRNGLWQVLFNAVFYCVSSLDARRNRKAAPAKELEVRTGGPEDEYEVVYASSADEEEEYGMTMRVPVPLSWEGSTQDNSLRSAPHGVADDFYSLLLENWWPEEVTASARDDGDESDASALAVEEAAEMRSARIARWLGGYEKRSPSVVPRLHDGEEPYGGRLHEPLPIMNWYFTLRCLAQVGYRRDLFFTQTPADATPHELLLALLWLTKRYQLIAISEYTELSRLYGFLLRRRADLALSSTRKEVTSSKDALLSAFPGAIAWPPASFDEASSIRYRGAQVDRVLGFTEDRTRDSGKQRCSGTTWARRLLAARRLITLSLDRLEHALFQRVEQQIALGLHAPLDAQLCHPDQHSEYKLLLQGLEHVTGMEARVRRLTQSLGAFGSLVAYALREERHAAAQTEDGVIDELEEDAVWLDRQDCNQFNTGGRGGALLRTRSARRSAAARMGQLPPDSTHLQVRHALAKLQATHTTENLLAMWKSLVRRAQAGGALDQVENTSFLYDRLSQRAELRRARETIKARYSLHSSLLSEVFILQSCQNRCNEVRTVESFCVGPPEGITNGKLARSTLSPLTSCTVAPLGLTTDAVQLFNDLRLESEAGVVVALGTKHLQPTEVGQPTGNTTTAAHLEKERLLRAVEEMHRQMDALDAMRESRAQCTANDLWQQCELRIVATCGKGMDRHCGPAHKP